MQAPWDDEQLEMLRLRQNDRRLHPYTHSCGAALIPTHSGWVCPKCLGPEVEIPGLGKGRFVQVVQDWCRDEDCGMPPAKPLSMSEAVTQYSQPKCTRMDIGDCHARCGTAGYCMNGIQCTPLDELARICNQAPRL